MPKKTKGLQRKTPKKAVKKRLVAAKARARSMAKRKLAAIGRADFRKAVDSAPVHIIITDPEGTIIYANFAAFAITGYSVSEMIGKTPKIWGGLMPKAFYDNFWKTIRQKKETFCGEVTNKRKNGETYKARITVVPLLDENRNITGYVSIEEDITALTKVQDSIWNRD